MKIFKTNEAGRSMVEMLGVLAIIGVLSVAGISGYTTAMRSYRTNEVVNAASMLYIAAMSQNAGNGPSADVNYSDIDDRHLSGVDTLQYSKDNKNITLTFTDENDCKMALNKLGNKASGNCSSSPYTLTVTFSESSNSVNNSSDPEPAEISGGSEEP